MEYRICGGGSGEKIAILLQQRGIHFALPCGGRHRCGKCRVQVVSGRVSPVTEAERRWLAPDDLAKGVRLACDCYLYGEGRIHLAAEDEEIGVENAGPAFSAGVGEAAMIIDLGTTTVVCRLVDRHSLVVLGEYSEFNCQRSFGADVISRISAALRGDAALLRDLQREQLRRILEQLRASCALPQNAIREAVLVANTAELHLLTGADTRGLAAMPFLPAERFGCRRLDILPNISCYLPPVIGAYLGADITAGLLAAGMDGRERRNLLFLDLGTNGEIVLQYGGHLLGCSAAAGPVFEGAGLYHGMAARPGAVYAVALIDGKLRCRTIGNQKAVGICGSGVISLLAALLRCRAVDASGRLLQTGHVLTSLLTQADGKPAIRLPDTDIVFTQADIRCLQTAKAAIAAAVDCLLAETGVCVDQLDGMIIAGSFGAALDVQDARCIGLLPRSQTAECCSLGNTALHGATLLLEEEARAEAQRLVSRCQVLELGGNSLFQKHFLSRMRFG